MVHGFPSWILTDREAPGWESRRIDGLNYPAVSDLGVRKSHARGKVKSWPVGICPPKLTDQECAEHLPKILLCEGGPDFLAGCCIAEAIREIDVLPVTMLGKSSNIAEAALPFFAGRRVVIAGHGDASDRVQAWASQIEPSSRSVTVSLCPEGQDLNDLIKAGCSPADLYASLFPL
jgi:hypothetical protein